MSKPWLRLYRDALYKPKVGRLSLEEKGFWAVCLMASDDEGGLPSIPDLAWTLRLSEQDVSALMLTLDRNGLVTRYVTGNVTKYALHDWDEHQRKSDHDDSAAERQRKWRERQKAEKTAIVEPVTDRNALRNGPVTPLDTDTDTDKNNIMSGPSVPDGFEKFWKAYPRTPNMSKVAALKAWQKRKCSQLPQDQLLDAVAKYKAFLASESKKRGKEYPAKHAQGWISEQRWEGFVAEAPPRPEAHSPDWADEIPQWSAFKSKLPASEWQAWFATSHPNGAVTTLVAPSQFAAEQVAARYGSKLEAHFGEAFQIKTKGEPQ